MNLAEFHFIRPMYLWALLPCLLCIGLLLRSKLTSGNWRQICDSELLPYILQNSATRQVSWPLWSGSLAAFLCIIALAGPTWQRLPSPMFRNQSALVIMLDLSRSMDATDIKPSRLAMARYKIADILNQRKDGQTALLVYAGDAFTVTPLTEDTETINAQLPALTTQIMPAQGSRTAYGLQHAISLFKQAGLQQGHILLVTDGIPGEEALQAAGKLNGYDLSVFAVGTEEGAPIPGQNGGFVKDRQGDIVVPKLHADELRQLAASGGGVYQQISSDNRDIDRLMRFVDQQAHRAMHEQQQDSDLKLQQWQEQGPWLLVLALLPVALLFRKGLL